MDPCRYTTRSGFGTLRLENGPELLVEQKLAVVECQVSEDSVLVEREVGDGETGEEVCLDRFREGAVTRKKVEQLRLEGRAGLFLVESLEKGIGYILEDLGRTEALHHEVNEARFADANGSLEGDVLLSHALTGHGGTIWGAWLSGSPRSKRRLSVCRFDFWPPDSGTRYHPDRRRLSN